MVRGPGGGHSGGRGHSGRHPLHFQGVRKAGPVITDNGNQILDCTWKEPIDVPLMETKINSIVGVLENGLFSQNKPIVFIAKEDGSVETRNL